jgi:pyroglutamyl-peptidase
MTILVTGFEPFVTGQGVRLEHNPTIDVVGGLERTLGPPAAFSILPVSFRETKTDLLSLFERYEPKIWMGLGYAHHRSMVDVETIAVNVEHAIGRDNDGEDPFMRSIIDGAPVAYRTQLDVSSAVSDLESCGVEARPSFHAGTFLCNQTFYLGCHQTHTTRTPAISAFVHVPPMDCHDALVDGLTRLLMRLRCEVSS